MSLFAHIDPAGTSVSLGHIIESLLDQRNRLGLNLREERFSVAELRLTNDDVQWLLQWAGQAPGGWMNRLLESTGEYVPVHGEQWLGEVALGFVLTVVFSEYARRYFQESSESGFWACLNHTISPRAAQLLFPDTNPTSALKDALQSAMVDQRVHLRHRFAEPHVNAWYSSIFAQFGVTRAYIVNYLRSALVGLNVGRAVSYLLRVSKGAGSFTEFWQICDRYRRGLIQEKQARLMLQNNSFVLPDSIDAIIRACESDLTHTGAAIHKIDYWQEFVNPPRLIWNGAAAPQFELAIESEHVDLPGLDDAKIFINGHKVQTLLRKADSASFEPCGSFRVSEKVIAPTVTVLIATEEDHTEQEVRLWNEGELATLYDLETGLEATSQTVLAPNHSYAIIIPNDLLVKGGGRFVALGNWRMYYIARSSAPQIEIVDATGVVYLKLTVAQRPTDKSYRVTASPEPYADNENGQLAFRLRNKLEQQVDIETIRIGAKTYPVELNGDVWLTGMVELGPEWVAPKITLYAKLTGQPMAYMTRIAPFTKGCLIKVGNFWRVMKAGEELVAEDTGIYLQALGYTSNENPATDNRAVWVDGTIVLGDVYQRAQLLQNFDAYGESLRICRSTVQNELTTVSESVVWRGLLRKVQLDAQYGTAILALNRDTNLDGYMLALWHLNEAPKLVQVDGNCVLDYENINTTFHIFLPQGSAQPHIVALLYEGECHGVWWASDHLPARLPESQPTSFYSDVLKFMRWFHVPILRSPFSIWAVDCIRVSPPSIEEWTTDLVVLPHGNFSGTGTRQSVGHDAWFRAVRQFLHANETAVAPAFTKGLQNNFDESRYDKLLELSPRLALLIYSAIGNRLSVLNMVHSPDDFAKAIEIEHLPYDVHKALYAVEEYLRTPEYPLDLSVLQLLNSGRTRKWIIDHCLRLDSIHEMLRHENQARSMRVR